VERGADLGLGRAAAINPKDLVLAFGELVEPASVASSPRHHPAVAFEEPSDACR
jgi:hypothetical protein